MADYRQLAKRAREWADQAGIVNIKFYRSDEEDDYCLARFAVETKDDFIAFSLWKASKVPAMQRFSAIASDRWDKYSQLTNRESFEKAEAEFSFVKECGMSLSPGEVSEVLIDGEGPVLDEAGLSLIDELEKSFAGLFVPEGDD